MRVDQREPNQLRPLKITPEYLLTAEGSVLIEAGNTRVLWRGVHRRNCPGLFAGTGKGWVTAEYSMLPRATATRTARESRQGPRVGANNGDPEADRSVPCEAWWIWMRWASAA